MILARHPIPAMIWASLSLIQLELYIHDLIPKISTGWIYRLIFFFVMFYISACWLWYFPFFLVAIGLVWYSCSFGGRKVLDYCLSCYFSCCLKSCLTSLLTCWIFVWSFLHLPPTVALPTTLFVICDRQFLDFFLLLFFFFCNPDRCASQPRLV